MGTDAREKGALRSFYFTKHSNMAASVADIWIGAYGPGTANLNRINVHNTMRGKGHGRELLKRILADADSDGITMFLEINAYGPMDHDELEAWYMREGFEYIEMSSLLRRPPR